MVVLSRVGNIDMHHRSAASTYRYPHGVDVVDRTGDECVIDAAMSRPGVSPQACESIKTERRADERLSGVGA